MEIEIRSSIKDIPNRKVRNFDNVNVLMGKNGSGKSLLLRGMESKIESQGDGKAKYISPERAGNLEYKPNILRNMSRDDEWLRRQRDNNQVGDFKPQTVALYQRLEKQVLRSIEREGGLRHQTNYTFFEDVLGRINEMLKYIKICQDRNSDMFDIISTKDENGRVDPSDISSGESELISLAIELLEFKERCRERNNNFLLMDEPDLHLHPDLQHRFINFVKSLADNNIFRVVIATHSSAILGALSGYGSGSIHFLQRDDDTIEFKKIDNIYREIIPVFGAHPLSNVFNESPILLVEGPDDRRIWRQAVRTSEGQIKLNPREVGGEGELIKYERRTSEIISSVYDDPEAFSLRDSDNVTEAPLSDIGPVVRLVLDCREIENLLLTDDVLKYLGTDWGQMKSRIDDWINRNEGHISFSSLLDFKQGGYERNTAKISDAIYVLMELTQSAKPWQVAIGQSIAGIQEDPSYEDGSLSKFLGRGVVETLVLD